MYNSFEQIPWIVAILGCIVVGGTSYLNINDFWVSLDRAGIGYGVFWLIGYFIQKVLEAPHNQQQHSEPSLSSAHAEHSMETSDFKHSSIESEEDGFSDDDKE
jgi:hypothetical protein